MSQSFLNEFKRDKMRHLPGRRLHYNELKFPHPSRKGFTEATMRTTIEIVMWCWKDLGIQFMTEVPMLKGRRRADVVIPQLLDSQVIEIYDSETKESLEAKKQDYEALGVTMLAVPADPQEAIKRIKQANNL